MLLKELLARQGKEQKDLAKYINIDKVQMSEIANYKCLPTPEQAKQICEFLDCNILDIYNKKEIDLILGCKRSNRVQDDNLYYRLSVRLNKSGCNCLKQENLHKLGYKILKSWVLDSMEQLKQRLKEHSKDNEN